ncbi:hypothetical protein FRC04_010424 [Tulasnella sp. 424]|nr:hypothetical protein FRC04_010424 [Tulasnella sp. 424]KAG8978643.1 hypothetical protein FRC05_009915 [Tulasnella sp. 425]
MFKGASFSLNTPPTSSGPKTPRDAAVPTYVSPFSSNTPSVVPKIPQHAAVPMGIYGYRSPRASDSESFLWHQLLLYRQGVLNVIFDVRVEPSKAYISSQDGTALPLTEYFHVPATQPLRRRIQLISRYFDWHIVVENPKGVTLGDILSRIRDSLNKNASKEEYDAVPKDTQADIVKAYQRNCSATSNGVKLRKLQEGLKRVDWLGRLTLFAGMQKDEAYINGRIRSHSERAETYVVEFSR